MMKLYIVLALISTLAVVSAEWALVWEDEFNGGNLADRWNFELGCSGWGNNELQCYTNNRAANARQENGRLIITAVKEWWGDGVNGDKPFTSARMTTKASWLHGMMPTRSEYGGWPRSGEMDIMEYRGQRPNQVLGTLHFGPAWDNKGDAGTGERNFDFDFSSDFHTFGFDWSPTQIQWLVDDRVYHTETLNRNFWPGLYNNNGSPFDKEFFIILNLAVGGNFFGGEPFDPEEANGWAKNTFEIDYVKKFEWR